MYNAVLFSLVVDHLAARIGQDHFDTQRRIDDVFMSYRPEEPVGDASSSTSMRSHGPLRISDAPAVPGMPWRAHCLGIFSPPTPTQADITLPCTSSAG